MPRINDTNSSYFLGEMVVPAKNTTASKSKSPLNSPGIVEQNLAFKRKPDIALARSIVQPQRNKIAVRIVNLRVRILEVLDKTECNQMSGERKDDQ